MSISTSDRRDGLTFTSHGARLGIESSDPNILERARSILPVGSRIEPLEQVDAVFSLTQSERAGESHQLHRGEERLSSSPDLEPLLELLASELHFQVARGARTALFVHAGVVGWRDRAILLPNKSMSGKTSLVAALVRAGAVYYSDEYAVIDAMGRIHPYPRLLALREQDGKRRNISVESLGGQAGTQPLRTGWIVSTHYVSGARFDPEPLSEGEALLSLLGNTVVVRKRPQLAMDTLVRVTRGAVALSGDRGEADEAAPFLLRHLDEAPSQPYDDASHATPGD